MKAANLYAPGDIRYEEVPVPQPGPGEVLIKVKACGVCGSDIARVMQTGTYRFPTIPGREFAGEVVDSGPGTETITAGQRETGGNMLGAWLTESSLSEFTSRKFGPHIGPHWPTITTRSAGFEVVLSAHSPAAPARNTKDNA